jgi:integrase
MNLNIRWIKSRSKSQKKRNTEDAYIRMYTGRGETKLKRLSGVFKYTGRLDAFQSKHNKQIQLHIDEFITRKRKEDIQGVLEVKSFDRNIQSFVDYGKEYIMTLDIKKNSKNSYKQAIDSFEDFFGRHKTINSITLKDVKDIMIHMRDIGKSRYGSPYAIDTINSYLNRMYLINQSALENEEILCTKNYFKAVRIKPEKETIGEYISTKEYSQLDYTKCLSQGIAKAFMFSILSGLRKSDVETMIWKDIKKDEEGWYTYKAMVKGGRAIRVTITPMMLELLGERKGEYANVINWTYTNNTRGYLYTWLLSTFADKKIGQQKDRSGLKGLTFHSARASFITNLLDNGVSAFRVQKYVGHKDLKTTMRYYRGKSEMQQKDMLLMDRMYQKEIVGNQAKKLLEL